MIESAPIIHNIDISKVRIISITVSIILVITIVSLYVAFFMPPLSTGKDLESNTVVTEPLEEFYEGKIEYVDARLYPGLEVTHALTKAKGEIMFLLKAEDAILEVGEGHWAKVYGSREKEVNSKYPVFKVNKVVIKSNSK